MGLEIRYCDLCRSRISPMDVEAGKALAEPGRSVCPDCCKKQGIVPSGPSADGHDGRGSRGRPGKGDSAIFNPFGAKAEEKKTKRVSPPDRLPRQEKPDESETRAVKSEGETRAERSGTTVRRDSSRSARAPAAPKGPNYLLLGGLAAAGLLAVVVIVIAFSGGRSDQSEQPPQKSGQARAETKKPQPRPPPPADPDFRRRAEAEKAFKAASDFDRANPGKWAEARARYMECLGEVRGTDFEKRLLARLDEGDRNAAEGVDAAFENVRIDLDRYLSERNFKFAASLFDDIGKYSGNQAMLAKALELRTRVLTMERNWNMARQFPSGSKLDSLQERALYSLFAEAGFNLAPAPASMDSGWKAVGKASWSFENGVLVGRSENGPGHISFGDPEWTDYVAYFEFSATSEKAVHFLVHCDIDPSATGMKEQFKPDTWFQVRLMVWGDFLFMRFFDKARVAYSVIGKSSAGSERGGFGFRLAEPGHEVRVRGIKYRLLATPDKQYMPPNDGWHPMHESGMDLQGAAVEADKDVKSSWSASDGVVTGSSETGGAYLVIGSPSWTRFEFGFEARRVAKGASFVISRPVDHMSLVNGQYLKASFAVSPAQLGSDAWKDVRLVAEQDKAVLMIGGDKAAESPYEPFFAEGLPQAVRIGFDANMAGGSLQARNLRVKVGERGGGF